jgi:hypothetical protein
MIQINKINLHNGFWTFCSGATGGEICPPNSPADEEGGIKYIIINLGIKVTS